MAADVVRGTLLAASGGLTQSGVVPSATVTGDVIFVFLDVNQLASAAGATPATPSGYTALTGGPLTSTSAEYYGWVKVATGGEGGSTLSFNTAASVSNRSHLHILVIEGGTSSVLSSSGVGESTTSTTRVTPTVTFSGSASVVEHVCDKASTLGTNWTPPSGFTKKIEQYDTTSGQLTSVTALSNSNALSSGQGGDTYTETAAGSQAGKWTVAYQVTAGSGFYNVLIKQATGSPLPATWTVL